MFCISCGKQVANDARFCGSCGAAVKSDGATLLRADASADGETIAPPAPSQQPASRFSSPKTPRSNPSSGTLGSSDAIGGGRFVPGQIVAGRYRIVALAGRGGMGEVYRAEDLTLSQVVAIKFLPEALTQDPSALARFHAEVRIARQIAHPNVCRVFDIGDAQGTPFLTMEYVDGEDLASAVRRFGKLSQDKAVEIARQICAGLAAAHDRGVIHRDLKPANIMLDGAGKIRITDFGLASVAAVLQGAEVRAGTPAYMAPEQLAGREVTHRSDIYSVGLILYEVVTGKRAFEAQTLAELVKLREAGTLTSPSTLVRDLDPLVERLILRCLDNDPGRRPESALQLAAALPGGDPLAAALAAGETPSPEMVAAAGTTEGIRPRLGLVLLATVLIGLVAHLFLADRYRFHNRVSLDKSAELLVARSQEIIQQLGITEPAGDTAHGFLNDGAYLDYIQQHDQSQTRWQRLAADRPAAIFFWYRQSPRELASYDFFTANGSGVVTPSQPPFDVTGMVTLLLDSRGHLLSFRRLPPEHDPPASPSPGPDWSPLFKAAGLDQAAFTQAAPEWNPLFPVDARAAWTRRLADPPGTIERIEAASYRGRPVFFRSIYPWVRAGRDQEFQPSKHQQLANVIGILLLSTLVVGTVLVVRRNIRSKRGDEIGAARLGNFLFLVYLAGWALDTHHLASSSEVGLVILGMSWAFVISTFARLLYFGLEPFVRRRDPHTLIGWMRLIGGKVRDPLVARDVLIGITYGVLLGIFEYSDDILLPLFGGLPPKPGTPQFSALLGVIPALSSIFLFTWIYVLYALAVFFALFLLRLVAKRDWIAAAVIVFLGAITNTGGDYFWATFIAAAIIWLSIYMVLRRFGVLALCVGLVAQNILVVFPTTSHLNRWYASGAIAGLLVIVGITVFAFYNSLAGRPLLSAKVLED